MQNRLVRLQTHQGVLKQPPPEYKAKSIYIIRLENAEMVLIVFGGPMVNVLSYILMNPIKFTTMEISMKIVLMVLIRDSIMDGDKISVLGYVGTIWNVEGMFVNLSTVMIHMIQIFK